MIRALGLGILASLIFSLTYVITRFLAVEGFHWTWTVSLRFFIFLALLTPFLAYRNELKETLTFMKQNKKSLFIWGSLAFPVFSITIVLASYLAPAWVIATSWQVAVIAGILLTPLFFTQLKTPDGIVKVRNKLPWRSLGFSSIILIGVLMIQLDGVTLIGGYGILMGFLLVTTSAVSFILGNRKGMEVVGSQLNTMQRIYAMTLVTLPWWIGISLYGFWVSGSPPALQIQGVFWLTILGQIIALPLFYTATQSVRKDMDKLAGVEATQAFEVPFTVLTGMILLNEPSPSMIGIVGIGFILFGTYLYVKMGQKVRKTQSN